MNIPTNTPCFLTLVPVGGLANRMKAIDSAVSLASATGSRLRIVWFRDSGLKCRFDQLFAPLDRIDRPELCEATLADLLLLDRPRKRNFRVPRLYQRLHFDRCIYEQEATRLFRQGFDFARCLTSYRNLYIASCVYFSPRLTGGQLFDIFHPQPLLQAEIERVAAQCIGPRTVGIHIRRTDNVLSIEQSPTELFIDRMEQEIAACPDVNFYLATDSEEEKERLTARFGQRITTCPRQAERNSVRGVQDAVVELFLLSRTCRILGSAHSSYSETAAQLGGIPFEVVSRPSCPDTERRTLA